MVYDGYLLRLNSKHQLVLYVLHPCRLVLMEKYCNRTFEKQGSGILWMILLEIKINIFMVRYYQEQNKTEKMWRIFCFQHGREEDLIFTILSRKYCHATCRLDSKRKDELRQQCKKAACSDRVGSVLLLLFHFEHSTLNRFRVNCPLTDLPKETV